MVMKIVARPSQERGSADHGWLKSFHTFSFASYHDPRHEQYGCLRVINEDRVAPETGFDTHGHREFEIFSYVVSGQLEHRDSMGNTEVLKRGDLQMTSAGTGIRHSEKTYGTEPVHFLQIWSVPSQSRLPPRYFTRHFSDEEKKDRWVRVVAPATAPEVTEAREAQGPAPVHSPLSLYATLLSPSTSLSHTFSRSASKAYIHVIQTSGYNTGKAGGAQVKARVGEDEVVFGEGDGGYIQAEVGANITVENVGDGVAEILLFEME